MVISRERLGTGIEVTVMACAENGPGGQFYSRASRAKRRADSPVRPPGRVWEPALRFSLSTGVEGGLHPVAAAGHAAPAAGVALRLVIEEEDAARAAARLDQRQVAGGQELRRRRGDEKQRVVRVGGKAGAVRAGDALQ